MEKIIVLGSGGHAKSVVDAIEAMGEFEIVGFAGPDATASYRGYRTICDDGGLEALHVDGVMSAAFGIGYLGGADIRRGFFRRLRGIGFRFPAIVDPSAAIARDAVICRGAFVGKNVVVNSSARVGVLAIVNSGAIIEHECSVGDYAHVSVGAVLCGQVAVGEGAFVGAGSTVIQSLSIGAESIIGAGSTVLRDVPEGGKAVGLYA